MLPGWTIFTKTSPIITARTVVQMYTPNVLVPIVDSLEISFRSDIPLINEANIKGIAINFRRLIKIVPKGLNQSLISSDPNDV